MITQQEYEELLKQKKEFIETDHLKLGPHPIKWTREVMSLDTRDTFLVDFTRTSIKISKYSINKRYRKTIILIRYCSDTPHTNPSEYDGKYFPGTHLHLYKEGYDDRIAIDPSDISIDISDDMETVLTKLLNYFNVVTIPAIQNNIT